MFRHTLFWSLKEPPDGQTKDAFIDLLTDRIYALKDKVEVIRAIQVGRNRARVPNACDMAVLIDFDSWEDLLAFLDHPEHRKLADSVSEYRDAAYVVDFEF
ncbi:MAG: Dabb family protein [Pseudomonadota bacterium]